jgi:hypothetical protein
LAKILLAASSLELQIMIYHQQTIRSFWRFRIQTRQFISYFLTYNRAKGINKDTAEAANQVTIVQGAAEEKSHLIAKVDPNAGLTFENYHDGRNLIITFGAAAQDGGVDYAYVYFRHRL